MMTDISNNVKSVRARIASAAARSGRSAGAVTLLAASKTRTKEEILAAFAAGVDAAGENRAQELDEKLAAGAFGAAAPHFIGALQSNKAKLVTGRAALIHSVDSLKLGKAVGRLAQGQNIVQDVLIEINIGEEQSKAGVLPSGAAGLLDGLNGLCGLRVRGLMVIPPAEGDAGAYFDRTRELFERLKAGAPGHFDVLSMGMSGDFELAVEHGSTLVRVGTGIFGPRGEQR